MLISKISEFKYVNQNSNNFLRKENYYEKNYTYNTFGSINI